MLRIAIVTGASSGMGAEFVRQLDADPRESGNLDEVWLVARRRERLEELAGGLRRLKGRVLALDLAGHDFWRPLEAALEEARKDHGEAWVSLLVNNAGLGSYGSFMETPLPAQLSMVEVNIRALTELCWQVIPWLSSDGRILNVSSLAAHAPLGNFAVYGASKAFVRSFTAALAAELEPWGIRVTSLEPGSVASEFALVASAGSRQEVLGGYSVVRTVSKALGASRRGRWFSMPRLVWRLRALAGALAGAKLSARFSFRSMKRPRSDLLDRHPGQAGALSGFQGDLED